MPDYSQQLVDGYAEWKGWSNTGQPRSNPELFTKEIVRTGVRPRASILEIGIGSGSFLDWAESQGYDVVGIDINEELVAAATQRGHKAFHAEAQDFLEGKVGQYDLIVMFDVLEHLSITGIFSCFILFAKALRRGGKLLARFPNGASPFGRMYQYGDATHQTVLTPAKINQIALTAGMNLVSVHNAARESRSLHGGPLQRSRIVRLIVYAIRDVIQLAIGFIYFGKNIPMDPNVTVIVGKAVDEPST